MEARVTVFFRMEAQRCDASLLHTDDHFGPIMSGAICVCHTTFAAHSRTDGPAATYRATSPCRSTSHRTKRRGRQGGDDLDTVAHAGNDGRADEARLNIERDASGSYAMSLGVPAPRPNL